MTRWFNKRWVWAALAGASVTVGMAAGRGEEPPKVGSTISLPIDGKAERQFKVLKTEKQPDGTYLSELKDTKTGETLTLQTRPDDPTPKGAPAGPDTGLPKAKSRANDPLTPPATGMPDPPKEKDKRPLLGRLFGDKDKTPPATAAMPGPNSMPKADTSADSGKKTGLLTRIFGPKKPTGPSMPAATTGPVVKPSSSTPPPVLPVPPGGLSADKPSFPAPGSPPFPTPTPSTAEPPRVMPSKPLPATTPPAFPAPTPLPVPPISTPLPTPVAPPLPIPSVPPAPGGTSAAKPIQIVVPTGYVPPQVAFDRDVAPFAIALQTMTAPSARLTAARGLADGRHRTTEGVKAVLFQAAQMDPCGEVRAACITHLCDLGYFSPHFLGHIQAACEDTDPMVRDAAKAACAKMIRK